MSELLKYRRMLAAGGLVLAGGIALTGCTEDANFSGSGNSYEVTGKVHDVEKDGTIHINQDDLTVTYADGKAEDWFDDHKGQDYFSDEFNFDPDYNKEESGFLGDCEHNITVGHVYDAEGDEIDATQLQSGDIVEIEGRIRTSNYSSKGCKQRDKNVFDTVTITEE